MSAVNLVLVYHLLLRSSHAAITLIDIYIDKVLPFVVILLLLKRFPDPVLSTIAASRTVRGLDFSFTPRNMQKLSGMGQKRNSHPDAFDRV